MRVFVTGASGFIGSAVVPELLAAGHQVLGLARSNASAEAVAGLGAEVHRGDLDDLDSLRGGAAGADGVVHLGYNHDFSHFADAAATDLRAIETFGEVLEGTDRPLVFAYGTSGVRPGHVATERDLPSAEVPSPRSANEALALALATRGVRVASVRLAPSVHGRGDHGFVTWMVDAARRRGESCFVGDGSTRWPAVHRLDAARLFALAIDRAPAGAVLHGVADEGIATRTIAEVIGRHLDVPVASLPFEEAQEHFGFLAMILALDVPASSTATQALLDWTPSQTGLIADLDEGHYFHGS